MSATASLDDLQQWARDWLRESAVLEPDDVADIAATWRRAFGVPKPRRGYSSPGMIADPRARGDGARLHFQKALVGSPGSSVFVFSPDGQVGIEGILGYQAESTSIPGLARLRSDWVVVPSDLAWSFLASLDPWEVFLSPVAGDPASRPDVGEES